MPVLLPVASQTFAITGPSFAKPRIVVNADERNDYTATEQFIDRGRGIREPFMNIGGVFGALSNAELKRMTVPCIDALGYVTRIPTTDDTYYPTLTNPDGSTYVGGTLVNVPSGSAQIEMGWFKGISNAAGRATLAGRYRLWWDGEGSVSVSGNGTSAINTSTPGQIEFDMFTDTAAQNVSVKITSINASDHIRNIKCVRVDELTAFANGDVFSPVVLTDYRKFDLAAVRSLSSVGVNSVQHVDWAQRNVTGNIFGRWSWEEHIDFCNTIPAPMWACIPHRASDDYVTQLATLIKAQLDAGLICYVECSNETWNFNFAQGKWMETNAGTVWEAPNPVSASHGWHTKTATRFATLFNAVFTGADRDRIKHVMAGQAAHSFGFGRRLSGQDWQLYEPGNWIDPAITFDVASISNYFGNDMTGNATYRDQITASLGATPSANYAATAELVYGWMTGTGDGPENFMATHRSQWNSCASLAAAAGLPMLSYEGGTHMLHSAFSASVSGTIVGFFNYFRETALYADLYDRMRFNYQSAFGENAVMSQSAAFTFIQRFGDWGLKQYPGAPDSDMHMSWWLENAALPPPE